MVMTMAIMINVFNVHFDISLKAWPVLAFKVSCPIRPSSVIKQKIGHFIFHAVTLFVRFFLNNSQLLATAFKIINLFETVMFLCICVYFIFFIKEQHKKRN